MELVNLKFNNYFLNTNIFNLLTYIMVRKTTKKNKGIAKKLSKKNNKINYTFLKNLPIGESNFFVDVGAHNGVSISNSLPFIKKGWKCISVEPNPYVFKDLKKNLELYKNNVKFVQKAVSNKPGKAKFHFDKKGFLANRKKGTRTDRKKGMRSTIQPLLFNEMSDDYIMVNVDTLTNILDKNKAPKEISIISIDTEGLDYEVVEGLDTKKYKVNVIITEDYAKTKKQKYDLLKQKGYKHINQEGINSVWILKNN